jgi:transglutaminase-like putative cysteine protease
MKTKIKVFMMCLVIIIISLSFSLFASATTANDCTINFNKSKGSVFCKVINCSNDVGFEVTTPNNRVILYKNVWYDTKTYLYNTIWLTDGAGTYLIKFYKYNSNHSSRTYLTSFTLYTSLNLDKYLYPGADVESKTSYIKNLANKITYGIKTNKAKVKAILDYSYNQIVYDFNEILKPQNHWNHGAMWAYIYRTGICHDYADLFASLCRASGIRCKVVVGYVSGNFHAWNEVYLNNVWIKVCPTMHRYNNNMLWVKTGEYFQAN